MFTNRQALLRTISLAGIVAGALSFATAAQAGQCPADRTGIDVTKPVAHKAKDVTDTVVGAIDLAKEPANLKERMLRLRKLAIQPGGVVPWHSHGDRPAIIYIVEGEVIEYGSNCAVPIIHKAGDTAVETPKTSHWWENKGSKAVVLLSANIIHDHSDKNM